MASEDKTSLTKCNFSEIIRKDKKTTKKEEKTTTVIDYVIVYMAEI